MTPADRQGPATRAPDEPGASDAAGDLLLLGGGAGVAVGGRLGGRILDFLSQVVVARLLGPAGFGLYVLAVVVIRAAALLAQLGMHQGAVRFAASEWRARPTVARNLVRRSLTVALTAASVGAALLFGLAPRLATSVFGEAALAGPLRLGALGLPLVTLATVAAAATRASRRTGYAVAAEDVAQPVLHLSLLAALSLVGLTVGGATTAFVLSFGASLVLSLTFLRRLLPPGEGAEGTPPVELRRLLGYSLPTAVAGACALYLYWVDRLALGYFRPAAEVGSYQTAVQLTAPFAIVLGGFSVIVAPLAAALYEGAGGKERLRELWRVATRWGLCLAVPGFLTLVVAGRELVRLVFGSGFEPPLRVLVVLASAQLVSLACGPVGGLLIMIGREKTWLAISAAALAASVALNVVLVPAHGPLGAAAATAIALAGMAVAGAVTAGRALGGWPYGPWLAKLVAAAGATALMLILLPVADASWARVGSVAGPAAAGFWGALGLAGLETEDRLLLGRLRRRQRPGGRDPMP